MNDAWKENHKHNFVKSIKAEIDELVREPGKSGDALQLYLPSALHGPCIIDR